MTVADELRKGWALSAARGVGNGIRSVQLDGGRERVWATTTNEGHPGLLIRVGPRERLSTIVGRVARTSTSMAAEIFPFEDSGQPLRGLHFWCVNPDVNEAFVGFCDAFVNRCLAGAPVETAFLDCVDEFRQLVTGEEEEAPAASFVGLLGELWVLSELVAIDPTACASWVFPVRERHDFRRGNLALEVKTTLRSQTGGRTVTITSFDQLEPPAEGNLFLHWLRIERDPHGPLSVARLMEQITGKVDAVTADELRTRVLEGLSPEMQQRTFAIQERHAYRVTEAFPRLTSARLLAGTLDPGVRKVRYELDLSTASKFSCSPAGANRQFLGDLPT